VTFAADNTDTYYTADGSRIYVNPAAAQIGTFTVTATYTPVHGSPVTSFTVVSLTIECLVTSFTKPSNPANMQYTVYDDETEFDMSTLTYVQTPACGYAYTGVYNWEAGTNNYIKADNVDTGVIHIRSSLPQSAGTSTMSVSATIVIASNNGVPNAQFYPTGTVVFSVEIVNPCLPGSGVTISPLVFTPANPTVMDGNAVYAQWYRPTTSVDVTHDNSGGWCGPISYQVFGDTSGTAVASTAPFTAEWATITEPVDGTYRITFDTTVDQGLLDDQSQLSHTLYIKSTLTDWSHSEYDAITVVVTQATCDCSFLRWTAPSVLV
jgi:hypothetical protein